MRTARRTTLRYERTERTRLDASASMCALWELSVQAWQLKEGRPVESRLRRDIVRTVRGRR
jgi:hypothetical protein